MAARYAISLMALIGSVAAQGYSNSSSSAVTTTSSSSSATYTDGATPTVAGVKFLIETDTTYQGTLLTLQRKRQANSDISSCLSTCAASTDCEGASYVQDTGSCLYYSEVNPDTATSAPGTDFALVQTRASASGTSSVFNGTAPVTSDATSRTAGASSRPSAGFSSNYGNATTRATGSSTRSSGASVTGGASASRTSSSASSTGSTSAPVSTPTGIITFNGVEFLIEINVTYSGVTVDFQILTKRADYTLSQCLATCANNANCAGTAFDSETGDCTFYSAIAAGSRREDVGTTFGTVIYRENAAANGTGSVNGTTPSGSTPASNVTAESLICPAYNGHVITSSVQTAFAISCSEFLIGTTFDISSELTKRQAIDTGLPQTISNCVDLCSLSESCVGTTFEAATETCSYYSNIAYAVPLDGFDSATRVQNNDNAGVVTTTSVVNGQTITTTITGAPTTTTVVAPGQTTTLYVGSPSTATVFSTSVSTVYVYAGDAATAYPSGAVVTQIVPAGTTTYYNNVPTVNVAIPTVTITAGSGSGSGSGSGAAVATSTVTLTVDSNGNVIGSSTAGAAAGNAAGAGAAYPTVTVHDTVTYCPQQTTWTTIYT